MDEQSLVIVGNGMVGFRLCQRLVDCGITPGPVHVTVFGEEPRPAYDRVHLTDLFSTKTSDSLGLAKQSWYEDHGIDLHIGDPIVAIDRDECCVLSAAGISSQYDRLVLATGSSPFVPPIPGTDLQGVFAYRTVEDLYAIKAYATRARSAAVIGGGLLGLEAARAVMNLGLRVCVVEAAPLLLHRQLDEPASRLLRKKIEALGITVHTGRRPIQIEAGEPAASGVGARILHFENGETLAVELVIVSAGVRPRVELARAADLAVAERGGVLVDDHLATSDPRIFAVGECATHRGVTYGLALPGYQMVDVLVDNLVGGDAAFTAGDPSTKLKLLGVSVAALGCHDEHERTGSTAHVYAVDGVYRKLVVNGGSIIGALAVGEWDDLIRVREALAEPRRFSFWDTRRFRSTGSLFQKSESTPVHEWPSDALVCGCLAVRRHALTAAELAGAMTAEDISRRTGAGTMCGSCKPLLVDYVQRRRLDSILPSRQDIDAEPGDTPPTLRCSSVPEALLIPPTPPPPGDAPEALPASETRPVTLALPQAPPLPREAEQCLSVDRSASSLNLAANGEPGVPLALRRSGPSPQGSRPPLPRRPAYDTLPVGELTPPSPDSGDASLRDLGSLSLPAALAPGSTRRPNAPVSETELPTHRYTVPRLVRSEPPAPLSNPPKSSNRRDTMPPLRPITVHPAPGSSRLSGRIVPAPVSARTEDPARLSLIVTSIAALLAALVVSTAPPLAEPASIRGFHLATLAHDRGFKLVTGSAIVVCGFLSLLLSLRKRWSRFRRGDIHFWRAVHGGIGATLLLLIALHTGLQPGVNLNRLLATDVLALSLVGSVAGLSKGLGMLAPPFVVQDRRLLATRAHLLLLLPAPVLVLLHILSAYYF